VHRVIELAGYKLLAEMGMHDLTFEAVIYIQNFLRKKWYHVLKLD